MMQGIAKRWSRALKVLWTIVAVVSLVLPATPSAASVAPGSDAPPPSDRPVVAPGEIGVPSGVTTGHFWTDSTNRRGYLLADYDGTKGYQGLVSVDLDSGKELVRSKLTPAASVLEPAYSHYAAVDEAGQRLFVWYQVPGLVSVVDPNNRTATAVQAANGEVCTGVTFCSVGIMALDSKNLSFQRRMPLRTVSADGGPVQVFPRAIEFVPGGEDGDAKLLLLVEEFTTRNGANSETAARWNGGNLVYAVQLDPETGQQEWAVRVDACRGTREPRSTNENGQAGVRANPATIFRAQDGAHGSLIVGCHSGNSSIGTVVTIPLNEEGDPSPLPVEVSTEPPVASIIGGTAGAEQFARPAASAQAFPGPDRVMEMLGDPESGRVLMRVIDRGAEVWWVFDSKLREYIGTLGIGPYGVDSTTMTVLDKRSGRFYLLGPPVSKDSAQFSGGLLMADIRRTPLPQALLFPEFASVVTQWPADRSGYMTLSMDTTPDGEKRIFVSHRPVTERGILVIRDPLAATEDLAVDDFAGRTLDLEEVEGVTASSADGAARAYGLRALLVGGVDAATRVGPVDGLGQAYQLQDRVLNPNGGFYPGETEKAVPRALQAQGLPVNSPCTEGNRDLVLAFSGPQSPAIMDSSGGRAAAEPVVTDSAMRADSEAPVSRCSPRDWQALWGNALFGRAPADEPMLPWFFGDGEARCVSSADNADKQEGRFGDSVTGRFSAEVHCGEDEVSGWSQVRPTKVGELAVGEAVSRIRIYRDPSRGMVSRAEAVVRGVESAGQFRIDQLSVVAESWANGRRFTPPELDEGQVYDPGCDFERTAGTCYRRHIFGVRTPGYSCAPCGDEQKALEALNRVLGANGRARFRDPNPRLAKGADNGFIAAIQKADSERFADLVLNNDMLQTMVPGLEIIRYAAPNRLQGGGSRGRQIYQFAGVEVSSSYGISCLLIYDEATNTCAGEKQEPGAIEVSLSDPEGKPLAGGAFELRADVDADGVLGLKDTLLPDGACVTAEDGIGTCTFDGLQPGAYLVNQVAAPPGYAKTAEPWVSDVASGERRTVAFTNVSNMSRVELKATDENGAPLAGAVFAAYPDPDSDGKVAPDAKPAAECTTDAEGVCVMQVPAGSYVLVQTSAPGGLEGIEPVAFTFASGGQVAAVTVVNYPPEQPAAPDAPASSVDYSAPIDAMPPTELVNDYVAPEAPAVVDESVPLPQVVGDTITRVIRAPGDALRLLARDPKEAVAWTAALALFCLAAMAIRRRQAALALINH